MVSKDKQKYFLIDDDSKNGEADLYLPHSEQVIEVIRSRWLQHLSIALPWLLSCVLAITLVLVIYQKETFPLGSYETGFHTDAILPNNIPLEIRRFTGTPHFHQNGSGWFDPIDTSAPWPYNMQLFGTPSPEVDDNWGKLTGGRYISLSEDEAKNTWGARYHEYVDENLGGYSAG
ncbi:hypothetical protein L207DRAFT_577961 [Hyaloscypha variabilis F]|uniref:Uncharacterized protein n=1 Tax=Hyaloscypha variabilis (strain UAMH 11265 / GT02V1 / F) TaxID=1149755 RepID=A0A2J6S2P0_HYAVF|nr:hypothetical protein L207DRAFT_577961 [Hyaloscypha variabilis F]